MSNATKPTRLEKLQKQFATRLKKVEKVLPAAWEAAAKYGYTPEQMDSGSNWRNAGSAIFTAWESMSKEERGAVLALHYPIIDLKHTVSDIEDAILAEKKAAEKVAKKAAKEALEIGLRMTCQVCGRAILSNTGMVAHHGYERPGMGFQTDSCDGARHLPIEASTKVLKSHIDTQIQILDRMKNKLDAIVNEKVMLVRTFTEGYGVKKQVITVSMTRSNFASKMEENFSRFVLNGIRSFDVVKNAAIDAQEQQIRQQADYIQWQQDRFAAATEAGVTHIFRGNVWESAS